MKHPCTGCDRGWGSATGTDGKVASCHDTCPDLRAWNKKNPRICSILGVKVNQRFRIDYPKGMTNWLHINEDGLVEREGGPNNFKIGNSIAYAINHPESIHRLSMFTVAEQEDAVYILRLFPSATYIERLYSELSISDNTGSRIANLDPNLFPSIKETDTVLLSEIIEEE